MPRLIFGVAMPMFLLTRNPKNLKAIKATGRELELDYSINTILKYQIIVLTPMYRNIEKQWLL